jgi:uncharacterized protein YhaN
MQDYAGEDVEGALRAAEEENARLREAWQALILESGLNWASNDQLRDTLFRLQSPLPFTSFASSSLS